MNGTIRCSDGRLSQVLESLAMTLLSRGLIWLEGDQWATELTFDELASYMRESGLVVCDFCISPDPVWDFPARSFINPLTGHGSDGGWAACDDCGRLILQSRYRELLGRVVDLYLARHPEARHVRPVVRGAFRELLARFHANRVGPPRRIGE